MKKLALFLMGIFFVQNVSAFKMFDPALLLSGLEDSHKEAPKKGFWEKAEKMTGAIGDTIQAAHTIVSIGSTIMQLCRGAGDENKAQDPKKKREQDLFVARQEVVDSLYKNADGEIGAYGLPKACDKAIRKLVLMPGGCEELEEVKTVFKKYFVAANKRSIASRLLFWKKKAETK
jgi:hypothetical protein